MLKKLIKNAKKNTIGQKILIIVAVALLSEVIWTLIHTAPITHVIIATLTTIVIAQSIRKRYPKPSPVLKKDTLTPEKKQNRPLNTDFQNEWFDQYRNQLQKQLHDQLKKIDTLQKSSLPIATPPKDGCAIIVNLTDNLQESYLIPTLPQNSETGLESYITHNDAIDKTMSFMKKRGYQTNILRSEGSKNQSLTPISKHIQTDSFSNPIHFPSHIFSLN